MKLFYKLSKKFKFSQQDYFIIAAFLAIFCLGIFFRFYNYQNSLYFLYDQGRDAFKLKSIAEGDLTLIGPTSGLSGFFLGPLWYYAGVIGYLLSSGNPYGISLWYIFVASLALPIFILISRKLFPQKPGWQIVTFALLTLVPASINGSIFVWNPLLSLPLMALALYALLLARSSRLWLGIAFLALGFTLHAEFAYAIFLVPTLFLLIFWIRKKFNFLDYLIAGFSVFLTLVPQILFEIKNNFLMSKALMTALADEQSTIPLKYLWKDRPTQLFVATKELLVGKNAANQIFAIFLIMLIIFAIWQIWRKKLAYEWKVVSLVAAIPYFAYMFWGGNNGAFFAYYLTPHFIFLVPLCVFGIKELKIFNKKFIQTFRVIIITSILIFAWNFIYDVVIAPQNQAGIRVIDEVTAETLTYYLADLAQVKTQSDEVYDYSVVTFTPNYLTAQYDYMMQWQAQKFVVGVPYTQARSSDKIVYAIIEPDREIPEKRFLPWYENITQGRVKTRQEKVGVILLETWVDNDFAIQNNFLATPLDGIREKMCW